MAKSNAKTPCFHRRVNEPLYDKMTLPSFYIFALQPTVWPGVNIINFSIFGHLQQWKFWTQSIEMCRSKFQYLMISSRKQIYCSQTSSLLLHLGKCFTESVAFGTHLLIKCWNFHSICDQKVSTRIWFRTTRRRSLFLFHFAREIKFKDICSLACDQCDQ